MTSCGGPVYWRLCDADWNSKSADNTGKLDAQIDNDNDTDISHISKGRNLVFRASLM